MFWMLFSPSPLKLVKCYKQWLNSVFVSSMLKFWVLDLTYKCPNQCVFLLFLWLYFWFSWISFGEIFQNFHSTSRPAGYYFYRWQKTGLIDFPGKGAPTKVKYLLTVCQILRNFTEGNSRKFTLSFSFFSYVDVTKYRKTLTFPFERAQITWTFTSGARAILKL